MAIEFVLLYHVNDDW